MMAMEIQHSFEELQIPGFGVGMLLYGTATLATNDADTFFVKDIKLDGGAGHLERPMANGSRCDNLSQHMFKAIRDVLYDEKSVHGRLAAIEWSDALDGNLPVSQPVFQHRRGLLPLIRLNSGERV
jgi:hypothetical protein